MEASRASLLHGTLGRRGSQRLVFLLYAMACRVVVLCTYSLLSSFYPQYIKKWPYNVKRPTEYTGYVVGSFSPAFLVGTLTRQFDCRFFVVAGQFLAGGASILLGVSGYMTNWNQLFISSIVLRMTIGFGAAWLDVATFTMVITSYADRVGLATGLMEVTWFFGNAVGASLGGLLYDSFGFVIPSVAVGITTLLFALLGGFIPIPSSPQLSDSRDVAIKQTPDVNVKFFYVKIWTFWSVMHMVSSIVILVCIGYPQATMSTYLHKEFGLRPRGVGFVLLASAVSQTLFTPLVGRLCDVVSPRWFSASGNIVGGAGLILIAFGNSVILQVTAQVLAGIGLALSVGSGYTGVYREVCRKLQKEELGETSNGKLYGLFVAFLAMGETVGSLLGGLSAESMGTVEASIMWGGIVGSCGLVYLVTSLGSWVCGSACVAPK